MPHDMLAVATASAHQRARGTLELSWKRRGPLTVLDDLRQDGCLKARFPRPVDRAEATTLNTGGGVAGGDRLTTTIALHAGTTATLAAQAAERFYRALPADPPAQVRTTIRLAAGAALEWLPQESILFDDAALDRRLEIEMAGDASFLSVEALVFGRTAMGERVRQVRLSDTIRIRRDSRLVLHDAIRLHGPCAALLDRPAVGGGNSALATLVLVAPDAAARLGPVRMALAKMPVEAGASAWDGMLVVRLLARDGAALRIAVVAALSPLRDGRRLPRVWMC